MEGSGDLDSLVSNSFDLNNCSNTSIAASFFINGAADGISLTSCSNIGFTIVTAIEHVGQGVELVSGNSNISFNSCALENNASDGIKLTGTDDECFVNECSLKDNGGFGINIAASTCDDTTLTGNRFSGNTSGALQDLGVGLNSSGNSGLSSLEIKEHIRMKNTSGSGLVAGDLCVFKAVAAGDELTTTTTQGDDAVWAMAVETIANDAYGRFQTLGKTVVLKVDGTTDIAVGDEIGTFTTAKIGMKAAGGDMSIGIALEAYTTDDSAGVIDALLYKPRKI